MQGLNVESVLARDAHHQVAETDRPRHPRQRPVGTAMRKPRHQALQIALGDRLAVKSK